MGNIATLDTVVQFARVLDITMDVLITDNDLKESAPILTIRSVVVDQLKLEIFI
jgi:hypothetical protein